jgi:hypothetical protein
LYLSLLFLQDDLTKMNQELLFEARRATKLTDSQFTHAWVKYGRVLFRQKKVSRPFVITSSQQIRKLVADVQPVERSESEEEDDADLNSTVRDGEHDPPRRL